MRGFGGWNPGVSLSAIRCPAEQHADGTITAKGPIPEGFFTACPHPAPALDAAAP